MRVDIAEHDGARQLQLSTPSRFVVGLLFLAAGIAAVGVAIRMSMTFEPTSYPSLDGVGDYFEQRENDEHRAAMTWVILIALGAIAVSIWYFTTGPAVEAVFDDKSRTIRVNRTWLGVFHSSEQTAGFSEVDDTTLSSYKGRMNTDHVLWLDLRSRDLAISGRTSLSKANAAQKQVRSFLRLG